MRPDISRRTLLVLLAAAVAAIASIFELNRRDRPTDQTGEHEPGYGNGGYGAGPYGQ